MRPLSLAAVACLGALWAFSGPAQAEESQLQLAMRLAVRAQEACTAKGFAVTVAFVGTDGQPVVMLRSDGAPIHTIQNSFNKAYTIMTLGPLMHANTMAVLAPKYTQQPAVSHPLEVEPLPHISFTLGSVLVRAHGRVLGGLGVSGSDSGPTDESCAQAGYDAAR